MRGMKRSSRRAAVALSVVAVLALAAPASAVDVSPSGPPGQSKPRPAKGPEVAVTVTGTVASATDAKGRPEYSVTASGTTWTLSAGPKWFWGANNPLADFVGDSVTIAGTHREGDNDLDVETVDGKAVREAGRPAWAGGPSWVGQKHPGWKAWKGGDKPGNGLGREGAPGQNKASAAPAD
jgi:hypothetical protein